MFEKITNYLERKKNEIVSKITNAGYVPEGNPIYSSHSFIVNETAEEIQKTESNVAETKRLFKSIADKLPKHTTLHKFNFIVKTEGHGEQLYKSEHKYHSIEPGSIHIRYGDQNIIRKAITKNKEYSEEKILSAVFSVLKNNFRICFPASKVIKDVADEEGTSYNDIEEILRDVFLKQKINNPEQANKIKRFEELLIPLIDEKKEAEKIALFEVIPYSKGAKKILFYNKQLVEEKIREINIKTGGQINKEENPFKLLKLMDSKIIPKSEWDAVANYISSYSQKFPSKSIIVVAEPNRKKAIELGKMVQNITKKEVTVEPIVEEPLYLEKTYVVDVKKENVWKKTAKIITTGALALTTLFFAYKGIENTFSKKEFEFKYKNQNINLNQNEESEMKAYMNGKFIGGIEIKTKINGQIKPLNFNEKQYPNDIIIYLNGLEIGRIPKSIKKDDILLKIENVIIDHMGCKPSSEEFSGKKSPFEVIDPNTKEVIKKAYLK